MNLAGDIVSNKENNLLLVKKIYKSYYDDDYCDFFYYDTVEKKIITDKWATAFGCPCYKSYEKPFIMDNLDKVNIDEVKEAIIKNNYVGVSKSLNEYINTHLLWILKNISTNYSIKCEVDSGRKFKGQGYLINTNYKIADMGYNRKSEYVNGIIISDDNVLGEATEERIKITDNDFIHAIDIESIENWINNMDSEKLLKIFIYESTKEEMSIIYLKEVLESLKTEKTVELFKVYLNLKFEDKVKFIDKKYNDLYNWAKDKCIAKTEEELKLFIINLMIKKYGKDEDNYNIILRYK